MTRAPLTNAPRSSMRISRKKRSKFLELLAQTGRVGVSARAVGYTSTSYLQKMRVDDEDFATDWELALTAAADHLGDVAVERAENGVMEPIMYKGSVVGHKINYSDSLLMFVLKKLDPAYRDRNQFGDTNINFGVAILPMTAPNDGDWEERTQAMHSKQTVIELEAKPVENQLKRIKRGD